MKKRNAEIPGRGMAKAEFEILAQFRYQLRCFLRFSEEVTRRWGVTPLKYQLMLQISGFPGSAVDDGRGARRTLAGKASRGRGADFQVRESRVGYAHHQ